MAPAPPPLSTKLTLSAELQYTSGRYSCCFFDEFDTRLAGEPLGWHRWFLSPMQDGKIRHGEIAMQLGKAVFVFAGGVNERFEDFSKRRVKRRSNEWREWEAVKGPDFASRLRGYVDVAGVDVVGRVSPEVMLRRAILLRSLIESKDSVRTGMIDEQGVVDIDPGVVRAFLKVESYIHGVRSIEAILDMCRFSSERSFSKADLPALRQLSMHVDAHRFMPLCRSS